MSLTVRTSRWIQRLVERGDPAVVERLISNSRNHQEIASARGRYIGDTNTFGEIAIVLLIKMIDQFPGRATRDADGAEILPGIDMPARFSRSGIRGDIGENNDWKFQAFSGMHGHDPHTFRTFFNNRRFSAVLGFGLLVQLLDKAAERVPAANFVSTSQVANVIHVGKDLISGRTQGE